MRVITLDNKVFNHPTELGAHGEAIVTAILPGAININEKYDARKPYDVDWSGILINVKLTSTITEKDRVNYSFRYWKQHQGLLLVHVAFKYDKYHFWVQRYGLTCKYSFYLQNAVLQDELPAEVIRVSKTPIIELT